MAIEVKVPDIGDFKDVAVIEVMVAPGETIAVDTGLIMVESDKASMEIPSSHAGVVKELKVKVDDTVSEGTLILTLEDDGAAAGPAVGVSAAAGAPVPPPQAGAPASAAATPAASPAAPPAAPIPNAATYTGKADAEFEMLVIGAGPGGYSAAFRAADLGMKTVLVERYDTLGGVCLNVGCIPSKALLHTASIMDEVRLLPDHGIAYGDPVIDLDKLRGFKDGVVKKLTGGLAGMARARKVEVVTGVGTFLDPFHLEVTAKDGGKRVLKFAKAIIAAGSESVKLPFLPQDDRIVDSTGALLLRSLPKRMLVIGGGIIGLEMATVYSALGARVDVVEMLDGLMQGADRDLVKVWEKMNAHRFDHVMLGTRSAGGKATADGIEITFEAAADGVEVPPPQVYDLVLVAVGRAPNGGRIGADKAGIAVSERGYISVDKQMRTNVGHIFAIGDLVGQPMLAHKAVHEGHVAAEAAHGEPSYFDARQIPSVAYTDPEVAWAGKTEEECKAEGIAYGKAVFPWAASGRAIANGRDEGFTRLLFDSATRRLIGGGIVGTHAGDLISEICLAIEMGCEPEDIGKTIHPHPTLSESIGMAAELFDGHCTDLPPQKKR
jgi:dihydrolipoamide dehydrogenase